MKVNELISIFENKLLNLNNSRTASFKMGDVVSVVNLDKEIEETQVVINKLRE